MVITRVLFITVRIPWGKGRRVVGRPEAKTVPGLQAEPEVPRAVRWGPERVQPRVDVLVTAVDLLDVVDGAGTVGAQGGGHQRHPGTDVRTGHADAPQRLLKSCPITVGAVGSQKDDLRAHVDELVHENRRLSNIFGAPARCRGPCGHTSTMLSRSGEPARDGRRWSGCRHR